MQDLFGQNRLGNDKITMDSPWDAYNNESKPARV